MTFTELNLTIYFYNFQTLQSAIWGKKGVYALSALQKNIPLGLIRIKSAKSWLYMLFENQKGF
jgi:hypothetical protein